MGAVALKKDLNFSSLGIPADRIYQGNPAAKSEKEYFILDPSGGSDEVRYSSWYDAVDAVIDSSREVERAVAQGLRDAQIIHRHTMHLDDYLADRKDWLQANAKEVLGQFGFRILDLEGKE